MRMCVFCLVVKILGRGLIYSQFIIIGEVVRGRWGKCGIVCNWGFQIGFLWDLCNFVYFVDKLGIDELDYWMGVIIVGFNFFFIICIEGVSCGRKKWCGDGSVFFLSIFLLFVQICCLCQVIDDWKFVIVLCCFFLCVLLKFICVWILVFVLFCQIRIGQWLNLSLLLELYFEFWQRNRERDQLRFQLV